ncbi:unnamed protein product [Psylliodes chrysocephalus]|uniref:Regulatory protein zeste n=1 Tax=Psylliodes chrysocephalus TaxID=3402493 RepID=A0A9P0D0R5_9CUCU|nr:unnamed protein product [Psylliodes chrysocephala]
MREKSLLIQLVEKYKNIIENKKSDAISWKDKDEAWVKISQQFNANCPENIHRKKESLKKTYENLKKNIRKDVADEKIQIKKTGGGAVKIPLRDPTFERTLALINPKTVLGLSNTFDGDRDVHDIENHSTPSTSHGLLNAVTSSAKSKIEYIIEEESENEMLLTNSADQDEHMNNSKEKNITRIEEKQKETLNEADWGNVNPSLLKTPVTPVLKTKNRWSNRRRPAIKNQTSSQLAEEYTKLANIKSEVWEIDKENKLMEQKQKQELFILQKKNLLLDIELKELQIKKIKSEIIL